MKLISISKASEILGVTPKTLRIWEKENKIQVVYTPNGHRRYEYDYIIKYMQNK
jgi:DNA-binding transcriptional MerR regulator